MPRRSDIRFAAAALFLCHALCHAAPDFVGEPASDDARYTASWVLAGADHEGRPFAIVDKREARIYVFAGNGRLIGASAVLLGSTPGDEPGLDVARLTSAGLLVGERTTPAGRFASEPGHNDKGEDIVWVDYDASLAIHRLRPAPAHERRAERLASPTSDDNRISFGCVVVPVAFYESVVSPSLGRQRGLVYVLPETRPAQALFGAYDIGLNLR